MRLDDHWDVTREPEANASRLPRNRATTPGAGQGVTGPGPVTREPVETLLTRHARERMAQRGVSGAAVAAVLDFGRVARVRGAEVYALGRQEVRKLAAQGIDVSGYAGLQVVCTTNGFVVTAYRNHDFRGLRPRGRRRGGRRTRL